MRLSLTVCTVAGVEMSVQGMERGEVGEVEQLPVSNQESVNHKTKIFKPG